MQSSTVEVVQTIPEGQSVLSAPLVGVQGVEQSFTPGVLPKGLVQYVPPEAKQSEPETQSESSQQ